MIEVYSWATPNGHKVHIMLEECGLPYRVHAVDIGAGDQFAADFLAISPNNKIPRSSTRMALTANQYRCSNRVRSCFTWPAKPASSCQTACAASLRCCSG